MRALLARLTVFPSCSTPSHSIQDLVLTQAILLARDEIKKIYKPIYKQDTQLQCSMLVSRIDEHFPETTTENKSSSDDLFKRVIPRFLNARHNVRRNNGLTTHWFVTSALLLLRHEQVLQLLSKKFLDYFIEQHGKSGRLEGSIGPWMWEYFFSYGLRGCLQQMQAYTFLKKDPKVVKKNNLVGNYYSIDSLDISYVFSGDPKDYVFKYPMLAHHDWGSFIRRLLVQDVNLFPIKTFEGCDFNKVDLIQPFFYYYLFNVCTVIYPKLNGLDRSLITLSVGNQDKNHFVNACFNIFTMEWRLLRPDDEPSAVENRVVLLKRFILWMPSPEIVSDFLKKVISECFLDVCFFLKVINPPYPDRMLSKRLRINGETDMDGKVKMLAELSKITGMAITFEGNAGLAIIKEVAPVVLQKLNLIFCEHNVLDYFEKIIEKNLAFFKRFNESDARFENVDWGVILWGIENRILLDEHGQFDVELTNYENNIQTRLKALKFKDSFSNCDDVISHLEYLKTVFKPTNRAATSHGHTQRFRLFEGPCVEQQQPLSETTTVHHSTNQSSSTPFSPGT